MKLKQNFTSELHLGMAHHTKMWIQDTVLKNDLQLVFET